MSYYLRLTTVFIFRITVFTAACLFLYNEIQPTEDNILPEASLTEDAVVMIIDERLTTVNKHESKEKLANLTKAFHLAPESTADNRLLYGKNGARITLQEFGDIECPYCRKMHTDIKQVIDHSEGVINWEFKHFPLGMHNPVAAIEAQAIECIKESYNNRTAWLSIDKFITDTQGNGKGIKDIPNFVRSFGLNGSLINNCIASDDHKEKINQDYEDGRKAGITATPAVRIIDNQTGKEYLLKGYKTSEMLLAAIQQVVSQ